MYVTDQSVTRTLRVDMVVYVGFRRGNWLYRMAAPLLPFVPKAWIRSVVADSWMQCALLFTCPCAGVQCTYCPHSPKASKGVAQARKYHMLTIRMDDEQNGIVTGVDVEVDKPDAWVLVRVANISDTQAMAFWQSQSDKEYNTEGMLFNFLPSWIRMGGGTVGVKATNDPARGFFCSEMVTVFLQKHKGYTNLGLVPCETTPQQLYDALVVHSGGKLAQFRMQDGKAVVIV